MEEDAKKDEIDITNAIKKQRNAMMRKRRWRTRAMLDRVCPNRYA
jgi:hypothetical protein